jgi:hypothetical protein
MSHSIRPQRHRCRVVVVDRYVRVVMMRLQGGMMNGVWAGQVSINRYYPHYRRTMPQHHNMSTTSHGHHGGGPALGHDRHHFRHHQAEPSMSGGPRPRSTHHTNDGLEEQFSKLSHHHNQNTEQDSIDGSCDLTAEISYRSSGSRTSHTSSISSSSHSNSSSTTQRVVVRNVVCESPNYNQEEEYVCGMEFDNGRLFYTGQIDKWSRLPHGLGTLRDNHNCILLEGEWHNGTLVAPAASSITNLHQQKASSSSYQVPSSYEQENEYDSHPETEDEVDDDDDDVDNTDDDNSSISSDALSVTYSSSSSSRTSSTSSRFAETKKSPLPPPPPTMDSRVRRVRWTEPQTKHYQT